MRSDSPWNQWLLTEVAPLFVDALKAVKERSTIDNITSSPSAPRSNGVGSIDMADLLSTLPLEREVIGFFRPASADIIRRVKGVECILTADGEYALPSSTLSLSARLRVHNSELLTSEAWQNHLHRRLVDASFQEALRPETRAALGIEVFDETHALRLMRGLVESSSSSGEQQQQPLSVKMIREWCILLYRAASVSGLGLSKESTVSQLRQLPIIPLKGSRLGLIFLTYFCAFI